LPRQTYEKLMERKRERRLLSVEFWQMRSACSLMRGQAHIDQHSTSLATLMVCVYQNV